LMASSSARSAAASCLQGGTRGHHVALLAS
jgi:hypothetical protein